MKNIAPRDRWSRPSPHPRSGLPISRLRGADPSSTRAFRDIEKFRGLGISLIARRQRVVAEIGGDVRIEGGDDVDDQPTARDDIDGLRSSRKIIGRVIGGGHRRHESDVRHLCGKRCGKDERIDGVKWPACRVGQQCRVIRKENGVEPAFVSQFRQSPVIADIVDIVPVSAPVFPGIGEVSGGIDADIEIEPAFVRAHAATFSFRSVGLPACGSDTIAGSVTAGVPVAS